MLKRFIWKRLRLLVWHWLWCKIAKTVLVVGENSEICIFHSRVTTNRMCSSTRYIWLSYSRWKNIYWKFSADSGCTYWVRIFRHIDFTKMNQFICNKFTTFTATTTWNRFDGNFKEFSACGTYFTRICNSWLQKPAAGRKLLASPDQNFLGNFHLKTKS